MGDCWQPYIGRVIINFYMRHSKEGDVKIYSETEMVSMLQSISMMCRGSGLEILPVFLWAKND